MGEEEKVESVVIKKQDDVFDPTPEYMNTDLTKKKPDIFK